MNEESHGPIEHVSTLTAVWENPDFVLSRGRVSGRSESVWSLSCSPNAPPEAWARIEREFELRDAFDPSWALRPLAIERAFGRKQLLLADEGGELLSRCSVDSLDLPSRLAIALGAAKSVRGMHERELIHRDLHPGSLIVDVGTGAVRLRGTGFCSRFPRGRAVDVRASSRIGTLQYASPEQTGRLNRSVDSRSDLYSLGITLYELFAGAHPFSATEPLEWMHCHVARQPAPLHLGARRTPVGISAVVHKLIAKTPEERYQTAAGLFADLCHCALELDRTGDVASFALGSHDASPELRIPERLYGRSRELRVLHDALTSVSENGRTRVVTISGSSGIGKSSLVAELQTSIIGAGGHFAVGKVDQLRRDIPYASVAEACRALVRTALSRSDGEIASVRSDLHEAMGPCGQLLVDLIPELEHLVGKQPVPTDLPPDEAKSRFHQLFQRFLGAFARAEHPLTLFLDDVQWLDAAALELVEALIAGNLQHMLLVCAYRENEVRAPHPFLTTLELLRGGEKQLDELRLDALTVGDLTELLGDALRASAATASSLSSVVHEKTAGNPFFVTQFLTSLVDDGMLRFDRDQGWRWEIAPIRAKSSTANVVELMVGKFDRLPASTQCVLTNLACLGRSATTRRLASACALSASEVDAALWELVRSRLVDPTADGYAFSHDRVQEASYALVPLEERAGMHVKLGRMLGASMRDADSSEELFETIHQYDLGLQLVTCAAEQMEVARLYAQAGLRARRAMAPASALGYFARGRVLLGEHAWERCYELCLELELGMADATFLSGDPNQTVVLLSELEHRTRSHCDRAAVTRLLIIVHSALDQQREAIEVCLRFLRRTGDDWSPDPSREVVEREYREIFRQLEDRSIESLIELPTMVDQDRRATLDVLTAVLPVAIFLNENLHSLAICRMVNMSLAHGNSAGSCFAYAMFGRVLGHYFGNPVAGFRFGRLAYDLLERPGMSAYRARVSSVFSILIDPWTSPLANSIGLTRRAFNIARETGDLTFATYSCPCLIALLLASGSPLADVEAEATAALKFAREAKFGQMADILETQTQLIRALRGSTSSITSFDDGSFDERVFEQHLASNPGLSLAACWYWIRKLQGRYLGGDLHEALAAGDRAGALLWTSGAFIDEADYEYHHALTLAALFDSAAAERRDEYIARVERHLQRLEAWSTHCATNFGPKATLVAAERARMLGDELQAMRLYERAISAARESGFVHEEAVAHEVAGRFYASRKLATSAHAHLVAARSCYHRWGATAKQQQLDAILSKLSPTQEAAVQPQPRADDVDLATVVKTSRAVSNQVGHERVVRSLMEVAVEHAGAQRGLLLLEANGEWQIEAEATTRDTVRVVICPTSSGRALPESVVRYVIRTRETVLLDDGSTPHSFAADEYFARCSPRSVLCLPIQKQTELIGVLYLENNLAPYVFTYTRVEVLKLLAAQAAISLENASLEEKEVLLKEVHHRVKNNLQLISSMLNLQASRVGDPHLAQLFVDCRSRVRSIALVHENLYRAGNFSHIPMAAHLKTLCAGISRTYGAAARGISIEVAVEDIHLGMGRAITCGLIINELVANALKHGFPDGRAGTVQVELVAKLDGAYELSVTDDGVGLDGGLDFTSADTLGLQLVQDFVQQLHGQVDVNTAPGYTRITVSFSAESWDEPGQRGARVPFAAQLDRKPMRT